MNDDGEEKWAESGEDSDTASNNVEAHECDLNQAELAKEVSTSPTIISESGVHYSYVRLSLSLTRMPIIPLPNQARVSVHKPVQQVSFLLLTFPQLQMGLL